MAVTLQNDSGIHHTTKAPNALQYRYVAYTNSPECPQGGEATTQIVYTPGYPGRRYARHIVAMPSRRLQDNWPMLQFRGREKGCSNGGVGHGAGVSGHMGSGGNRAPSPNCPIRRGAVDRAPPPPQTATAPAAAQTSPGPHAADAVRMGSWDPARDAGDRHSRLVPCISNDFAFFLVRPMRNPAAYGITQYGTGP